MLEKEAYRGTGITQIFFQIMYKTMLFFLKQRNFFLSMLLKKTKNTKQSPAVYVLSMQHDIFFTLNYSLALINTTYYCHFTVNLGSTKAQSSKRRTRTMRVTFFPQDTGKVKIDWIIAWTWKKKSILERNYAKNYTSQSIRVYNILPIPRSSSAAERKSV